MEVSGAGGGGHDDTPVDTNRCSGVMLRRQHAVLDEEGHEPVGALPGDGGRPDLATRMPGPAERDPAQLRQPDPGPLPVQTLDPNVPLVGKSKGRSPARLGTPANLERSVYSARLVEVLQR